MAGKMSVREAREYMKSVQSNARAAGARHSPEYIAAIEAQGHRYRKPEDRSWNKAIGTVGDVVGKAAPFANFIPGVGPIASAALTAGGRLAGKFNDPGGVRGTKIFKDVALPAAGAYAMGKGLEAMRGGAAGAAGYEIGPTGTPGGGGMDWGGWAKKAGGWLLDNPDVALAGLSMYGNAKRQGRADDLSSEAIRISRQRAQEMAPIRAQMIQRLGSLGEVAPAHVSLRDPGNPYSTPGAVPPVAQPTTGAVPVGPGGITTHTADMVPAGLPARVDPAPNLRRLLTRKRV